MHDTLNISTAQLSTFLTSSLPPLITLYFTTPVILAQPVLFVFLSMNSVPSAALNPPDQLYASPYNPVAQPILQILDSLILT